jgi:hypothetical protein
VSGIVIRAGLPAECLQGKAARSPQPVNKPDYTPEFVKQSAKFSLFRTSHQFFLHGISIDVPRCHREVPFIPGYPRKKSFPSQMPSGVVRFVPLFREIALHPPHDFR